MQQNSRCRLCGERVETINHIISECLKLAQKEYKTRYDKVRKEIYWELCKKFKFDYTSKWHNLESVQENLYYFLNKSKLVTVVEGDPKAPFSIATTLRCKGGRYSFPGLLHFTLDTYLIMLSVKQGGVKYHF